MEVEGNDQNDKKIPSGNETPLSSSLKSNRPNLPSLPSLPSLPILPISPEEKKAELKPENEETEPVVQNVVPDQNKDHQEEENIETEEIDETVEKIDEKKRTFLPKTNSPSHLVGQLSGSHRSPSPFRPTPKKRRAKVPSLSPTPTSILNNSNSNLFNSLEKPLLSQEEKQDSLHRLCQCSEDGDILGARRILAFQPPQSDLITQLNSKGTYHYLSLPITKIIQTKVILID